MSRAHRATATFTVVSWDETIVTDIDGQGSERGGVYYPALGLTQARVVYGYTGDIVGTGTVAYAFTYRKGASPIAGYERIEGSVGGQEGSFVLAHTGEHDATGVRARMTVVEGMGTGALEGMRGEATLEVGFGDETFTLELAYDM